MGLPDLHIVTFAVPYPAHYGGAMDVLFRIKALSTLGIKIHLHCFVYGSFKPHPALKHIVSEVQYYPRLIWPSIVSTRQPYIVTSRKYPGLLQSLKKDHQPILFDGIHTTGFAPVLNQRKRILRAHNIESQYYSELANQSKGIKSLIFRKESHSLLGYEQNMADLFDVVFAISPDDQKWYELAGANSIFLPPFHGISQVDIPLGHGQYLLFQGDLSLEINQNALLDLLHELPSNPILPMVVAGRSGNVAFEEKLTDFPNLRREADVSPEKMMELIQHAQVVLIHSLHGSGMKLKLFPALYYGKFVAATHNTRTETILDQAIHFYSPNALASVIEKLWGVEFTPELLQQRAKILSQHPGDLDNAKEIIRYL